MIELFRRAPRLVDPRFGELRWSRGLWNSRNARLFGSTHVQLRVPGSAEGIAPEALEELRDLALNIRNPEDLMATFKLIVGRGLRQVG